MRHVADHGLALPLHAIEVLGHLVEGGAQLTDLALRAHPDPHRAVACPHPPGRCAHRPHRPYQPGGDEPAEATASPRITAATPVLPNGPKPGLRSSAHALD